MSEHTDVGAYSMGLLEPADRQAFEDHLAGCAICAAEMAQLSPLAGLLRGIDPADVAAPAPAVQQVPATPVRQFPATPTQHFPTSAATIPANPASVTPASATPASATPAIQPTQATAPPQADEPPQAAVTDLLRKRAAWQRQRTRWQIPLAAAAAVVLIGGGVGIGLGTAPSHGSPAPAAAAVVGQLHSAVNISTGVSGTVGLVSKPWGTQVTMDLSNVRGPLECQLVAVSNTGEQRVVLGWLVPAAGYGVSGHPAHLVVEGGTSIKTSDLSRLTVTVVNGGTLLTIPTQSSSG